MPGLVWKENGAIRTQSRGRPIEDLDSLPFPDFSLSLTWAASRRSDARAWPSHGPRPDLPRLPVRLHLLLGDRDVRHALPPSLDGRASSRSWRSTTRSSSIIFFYDDNFTANPAKTKELLREMIRLRLGFKWSTQVRTDVARDPEMLDLMAEAGCATLYIGFESVDPAALKEMKKSQTVEEIRARHPGDPRAANPRPRHVRLRLRLRHPGRPRAPRCDFALAEKIDSAQFLILTPLPGSGFYTQMLAEGRLIDTRLGHLRRAPREVHSARLHPVGAAAGADQAHARFYSPWHVAARLLRGRLAGFLIGLYAGALNRRWQRQERDYLRLLRLLRPSPAMRLTTGRVGPLR